MVTPVDAEAHVMESTYSRSVHHSIWRSEGVGKLKRRLLVFEEVSRKANTTQNVHMLFEVSEFEKSSLFLQLQFQGFHVEPCSTNPAVPQNLLSYWLRKRG